MKNALGDAEDYRKPGINLYGGIGNVGIGVQVLKCKARVVIEGQKLVLDQNNSAEKTTTRKMGMGRGIHGGRRQK